MGHLIKRYTCMALVILFSNVELYPACSPSGTPGDDNVSCTGSITSFQYFYGGSDTVTLDNVSTITYGNTYWLDEALGGNPSTDGNDTFIARDSSFYWVLGFGGDDFFDIHNSKFNNAYGDTNPGHGTSQRGNDTILVKNSTSYGYILGGNDNDIIEIRDSNVSNVASGYSDIYAGTDYTPFDGNDTIVLENVNFNAPLYWDQAQIEGVVTGGRGDDTITFSKGGEAYYVYGGHGNDRIEVFDNVHFNACASSSQLPEACGIYGDESYSSELNASMTPLLHGDDTILLHDGDVSGILIQGGDGSDLLKIETPVQLLGTILNGGDDRFVTDTFVDRLEFEQWSGDLNGSQLLNWEQIWLHDGSIVTLIDNNISVGVDGGVDTSSGLPYGLIVDDSSQLNLYHDFLIDGNLHNRALLNFQDGNASATALHIQGDYTASAGEIYLDTVLNDATPSISDTLVVEGSSSGDTVLNIANIGGNGGQTPTGDNSGILVVEIKGDSNCTFTLSTPLQTADYWYHLVKGSNGNWYLQSEKKSYILTLQKTLSANADEDGSGDISLGDTLTYTIIATNAGNTALHQVEVIDTQITPSIHTCPIVTSGEECVLEGNYTVTQNDVNAQEINNNASVSSAEDILNVNTNIITPVVPQTSTLPVTPTPCPTPNTIPSSTPVPPTTIQTPIPPSNTNNDSIVEENCSCDRYKSDSVGVGMYFILYIIMFVATGSILLTKEN